MFPEVSPHPDHSPNPWDWGSLRAALVPSPVLSVPVLSPAWTLGPTRDQTTDSGWCGIGQAWLTSAFPLRALPSPQVSLFSSFYSVFPEELLGAMWRHSQNLTQASNNSVHVVGLQSS